MSGAREPFGPRLLARSERVEFRVSSSGNSPVSANHSEGAPHARSDKREPRWGGRRSEGQGCEIIKHPGSGVGESARVGGDAVAQIREQLDQRSTRAGEQAQAIGHACSPGSHNFAVRATKCPRGPRRGRPTRRSSRRLSRVCERRPDSRRARGFRAPSTLAHRWSRRCSPDSWLHGS